MTTIRELIDSLEEYAAFHGDDTEVRMMEQPNWPFEYSIGGVIASDEIHEEDEEEDEDEDEDKDEDENVVVYILEGTQLGYGSKSAWR